ncbi:hypothetical protein Tco_0303865 [Tanacetum coccineum]
MKVMDLGDTGTCCVRVTGCGSSLGTMGFVVVVLVDGSGAIICVRRDIKNWGKLDVEIGVGCHISQLRSQYHIISLRFECRRWIWRHTSDAQRRRVQSLAEDLKTNSYGLSEKTCGKGCGIFTKVVLKQSVGDGKLEGLQLWIPGADGVGFRIVETDGIGKREIGKETEAIIYAVAWGRDVGGENGAGEAWSNKMFLEFEGAKVVDGIYEDFVMKISTKERCRFAKDRVVCDVFRKQEGGCECNDDVEELPGRVAMWSRMVNLVVGKRIRISMRRRKCLIGIAGIGLRVRRGKVDFVLLLVTGKMILVLKLGVEKGSFVNLFMKLFVGIYWKAKQSDQLEWVLWYALWLSDQLEWVLWYAPWLSDQLEWICGMLHGLVINWSSFARKTSRNRVNVFFIYHSNDLIGFKGELHENIRVKRSG